MTHSISLYACISLLLLGCADKARCDADEELIRGSCFAIAADGGMDATADSGVDAQSCEPDASGTPFGALCADGETHTDCDCPAPFCAIQPGMSEGACTITHCVEDPSVCPDGWRCLDLSGVDPTLGSFCIES